MAVDNKKSILARYHPLIPRTAHLTRDLERGSDWRVPYGGGEGESMTDDMGQPD